MKSTIKQMWILLVCALFTCELLSAQVASNYFLHTVEKGQSLYSIAHTYGVERKEIVALNPGCENKIYAGQTLKIPQHVSTSDKDVYHTIAAGETLYKLTVKYKVSAATICQANPGLSAANFRIGQVVRIPVSQQIKPAEQIHQPVQIQADNEEIECQEIHKVKRKETFYSICRNFGISKAELIKANPFLKKGLKRGQRICIPKTIKGTAVTEKVQQPQSNSELFQENQIEFSKPAVIKTALILPFLEDKRMMEYYEGFLMAVDSMKHMAISIDLHVYNCRKDAASLQVILNQDELKSMNLIIGPAHSNHTPQLSAFTKKHGIRLVIPFSSKEEEVFNNPYIYLINTPQSYLYSEVYEHFTRMFSNANVIFMESDLQQRQKNEFIEGLKHELKAKNIPSVSVLDTLCAESLKPFLVPERTNIFVPTSDSDIPMIRIIPQLTLLKRENLGIDFHLFGYPKWQTYTRSYLENYFELDTYFYSSFYSNNLLPAAKNFIHAYRRWYSKDLVISYPQYAMLGFDTAFFFISNLSKYGNELEENLPNISVRPIQTGFKFERVNHWGGFINKKVFFIHFSQDYKLMKLDFE